MFSNPSASLSFLAFPSSSLFLSLSHASSRLSRLPFPSSIPSSEVAKFCQKYLADRVRAHDGFATKRDVPGALADCFHELDAMLASEAHAAELEAMRAPPAPPLHMVKYGSEEVEAGEAEEAASGGAGEEEPSRQGSAQAPAPAPAGQEEAALPGTEGGRAAPASSVFDPSSGSKTAAELMSEPEPSSAATAAAAAATTAATTTAAATTATTSRPPPPPPPPRPPPLNLPPPEERVVAGCTAVVAAVVGGETVYVANAGDSRAVLCDGAGRARPLSVDHKPAAPAEAARIRAAGGFVSSFGGVARVNGNLSLSRAIGDLQYKGNESLGRHEQVVTVSFSLRLVFSVFCLRERSKHSTHLFLSRSPPPNSG